MSELIEIIPVLPSADIQRDIEWYKEKVGFEHISSDDMYAVMWRDKLYVHLQWHADTEEDPLLGGSVIKIFVRGIEPIFHEMVKRGTVKSDGLRLNTPWGTNEFGFYDPNKNAIFFVEDV